MSDKKDFYEILGLTEEDKKLQGDEFAKRLKAVYRELALKYHPDKFYDKPESEQKEAEDKMKEINEAYAVLCNPQKRQEYDMHGQFSGNPFEGFQGTGDPMVDEMIRQHMAHMAGFGRSGFSTFHGFEYDDAPRVAPMKVRIKIKPSDIYKGNKKRIKIKRYVPCKDCDGKGHDKDGSIGTCQECHGTGFVVKTMRYGNGIFQQQGPCTRCGGTGKIVNNPCKHCNGEGRVREDYELTIEIPIGANDQTYLTYQGVGNVAKGNNNIYGDVYVFFEVLEENGWNVFNQFDIAKVIEIPILKCIVGGDMDVEWFDGSKFKITVPENTEDGKILNVRGKGLPSQDGYGNALIQVKHKFPTKLDKVEKETINKLLQGKHFK